MASRARTALDDLAERFDAVLAAPDPAVGLDLYRDLARFIGNYLARLHDEETLDPPTRGALVARLAASGPAPAVDAALHIAARVLDPPAHEETIAAAGV